MLPSRDDDTSSEMPSFGEHSDQLRRVGRLGGGILVWFIEVAEPETAGVRGDGGCYGGAFRLGERTVDIGGTCAWASSPLRRLDVGCSRPAMRRAVRTDSAACQ
jgi:hypothetical protein